VVGRLVLQGRFGAPASDMKDPFMSLNALKGSFMASPTVPREGKSG